MGSPPINSMNYGGDESFRFGKRLKILLVEDLPSDAELAIFEIGKIFSRTGNDVEYKRVDNRENLLESLESFDPDLVVSDYLMPRFDGMEVIEVVSDLHPELPVIILTGSINEETAAECMRAGAVDYVIKEHIARLPFAVKEALIRKKERIAKESAEKALRESEEKFRLIAEKANDLIYSIEFYPEVRFTYVSPSATKITGYTPEEYYNNPDLFTEIVHPDDRSLFNNLFADEQNDESITLRWIRKDGKTVWIEQKNVKRFDADGRVIVIDGIARDVTERQKANETLRRAFYSTVTVLSDVLNVKDPYTEYHQNNVAILAEEIAKRLGLDDFEIESIRIASMLHDIGKIAIPAEILSKPGQLSSIEFEIIRQHPELGYRILSRVDLPWPVADIVHQHHERLDGSGYPQKLKDAEILRTAKIIAVADVFEAMTSHRPYRPALGIEEALHEIKVNSGKLYDPDAVEVCISLIESGFTLK